MHARTCQVLHALRRPLVPSAGCAPDAELAAAVATPGPHVAAPRQGQRVKVAGRQSGHRVGQVHLLRHLPHGKSVSAKRIAVRSDRINEHDGT